MLSFGFRQDYGILSSLLFSNQPLLSGFLSIKGFLHLLLFFFDPGLLPLLSQKSLLLSNFSGKLLLVFLFSQNLGLLNLIRLFLGLSEGSFVSFRFIPGGSNLHL